MYYDCYLDDETEKEIGGFIYSESYEEHIGKIKINHKINIGDSIELDGVNYFIIKIQRNSYNGGKQENTLTLKKIKIKL